MTHAPKFLLTLLFLCIIHFNFAQDFVWAERGGNFAEDYISKMENSPDGNVIIAGGYVGSFQIDTVSFPVYGNNAFVAKIDEFGHALWGNWFGTGFTVSIKGIGVDPTTGDVYAAGKYYGSNMVIGGNVLPAKDRRAVPRDR